MGSGTSWFCGDCGTEYGAEFRGEWRGHENGKWICVRCLLKRARTELERLRTLVESLELADAAVVGIREAADNIK